MKVEGYVRQKHAGIHLSTSSQVGQRRIWPSRRYKELSHFVRMRKQLLPLIRTGRPVHSPCGLAVGAWLLSVADLLARLRIFCHCHVQSGLSTCTTCATVRIRLLPRLEPRQSLCKSVNGRVDIDRKPILHGYITRAGDMGPNQHGFVTADWLKRLLDNPGEMKIPILVITNHGDHTVSQISSEIGDPDIEII